MEDILNEIARLEEEVRKSQAREQEYRTSPDINAAEQGIARERSERQGYLEAIEKLRNTQTEIEDLQSKLEASAQRRAEYRRVGNSEQEAMENSEYAKITEQIQNLKNKALGKEDVTKEEIEKLKEEIRKSGERLKAYKESGAEEQYANEMSERQELLNRLDELKKKREVQLEEQLKACANRMKQYKEFGADDQYAMEQSEYARITKELQKYKDLQEKNNKGNEEKPKETKDDTKNPPPSKKAPNKEVPDRITIIYNPVAHTYNITGEKGKSRTVQAEAVNGKKMLKQKQKMAYIEGKIPKEFSDIIFAGISKKGLRGFDPNLVEILFNEYGANKDAAYKARDYMLALDGKTKGKNKENLPYKMIYDLRDIDNAKYMDNSKMGLFDKARLRNMVAANRDVANIIEPEKNKMPFWKRALLVATSAIMALGTGLSIKQLAAQNQKALPEGRSPEKMSDEVQPGIRIVDPEKEPKVELEIVDATEKKPTIEDAVEEAKKDQKTEFLDSIKYDSEQFTVTNETATAQAIEDLSLGMILQDLPEGLQFQEGMDGGRVGQIGNTASPKEGFYVIDRTIKIGNHSLDDYKYGLNGEKIDKDSSMVHISYVEGAKTYEEAKAVVEASKDATYSNEAKGIGQRGWIKTETLRKIVEQQQSKLQDVNIQDR